MSSNYLGRLSGGSRMRLLLAALVAMAAGGLMVFWTDSHPGIAADVAGARPVVGREEAGPTVGRGDGPAIHAPRLAGVAVDAAVQMSYDGSEPASDNIRRVLPSVTERPLDWREFRPDLLTVAPYPDVQITFTRTALKDEGRYVTWIGRNPDLPGASFVGVATDGGYNAILVLPGMNQFSFHVSGEEVVVEESASGDAACGNDPVPPKQAGPAEFSGVMIDVSYAPGTSPVPDSFAAAAPLYVDVLIAYDADVLAAAAAKSDDAVGYIDGQCKALLESCNLALAQSLVTNFAWRYLGAVQAPAYTRTGKLQDDVAAMAPGGAIGDWAKSIRYQRGADQICLLVGGANDWGGYAYGSKQVASTANFSLSAVKWGRPSWLFAHEWAHNFGCKHDRAHYQVATVGATPVAAPDNDGFWCYGRMWTNPAISGGGNAGTSGTIMSYADYPIPYFSNPNVTVQVTGLLAGWSWNPPLGTHQTGLVETDPKAAYNARVLNDQALAMSSLSEEIVPPVIEQLPSSLSVARGETLTMSITASGGGLSYQWMKNGVAISGATAKAYTKTAAEDDAGSYSVAVSNWAGIATSNVMAVTVTVPAPPPASVSTSPAASGGGGGGAPGVWFVGVLGLLGLARWRQVARSASNG